MRITCSVTKRGTVFRFYKDDDHFQRDLRPLVLLILACNGDILVGEEFGAEDPDGTLLLTAGPLTRDAEVELLRRAGPFLATNCPPAPPP